MNKTNTAFLTTAIELEQLVNKQRDEIAVLQSKNKKLHEIASSLVSWSKHNDLSIIKILEWAKEVTENE